MPAKLVQAVVDYVAGMTDRFAIREYERLFVPKKWLAVARVARGRRVGTASGTLAWGRIVRHRDGRRVRCRSARRRCRDGRGGRVGRISDEDVRRVRDATDLVALGLRARRPQAEGPPVLGLLPLPREKTPSFKIDPATQLWHCFGCGLGGDAYGFVMRTENVDFGEAVRILADRAHIEIAEEAGGVPARPA